MCPYFGHEERGGERPGRKRENTNPSERVLNNHLTVSIGNPWKQVSHSGINLSMVDPLRFRNRLRPCVCYRNGVMTRAAQALFGLLNNDLPDMMANSMDLVGEDAFIETSGILCRKKRKKAQWLDGYFTGKKTQPGL